MSCSPTLHYHVIKKKKQLWIVKFLCLVQVSNQQVRSLPRGIAVYEEQRPFQQQQLPVHPPINPHQPVRVQRPQQDSQLFPVWEWISECGSYLICFVFYVLVQRFKIWIADFSPFPSQAQFSDTEEDYSSRTPVSRHLSGDAKQVRHASQRSKVRGYNTEYERTSAHNATDPAICHLSPITVSIKASLV